MLSCGRFVPVILPSTLWLCDLRVGERKVRREGCVLQHRRRERSAAGAPFQRLEVEPGLPEKLHGSVVVQPGLQQQLFLGRIGTHDVVAFAIRCDRGLPAVCGGLGLVHDQCGDGTTARGLVVFVGPARVIRRRLATELAVCIVAGHRFEIRIVDQEDRNLATQVDVLVIVPVALGRMHAVADEHQRRGFDMHAIDRSQRDRRHVGLLHQRTGFTGDSHGHPCVERHLRPHQGHDLRVRAVVAGGFETDRLELLDKIIHGPGFARRARRASLELVRGQRARDARQPLDADRLLACWRRDDRADRDRVAAQQYGKPRETPARAIRVHKAAMDGGAESPPRTSRLQHVS